MSRIGSETITVTGRTVAEGRFGEKTDLAPVVVEGCAILPRESRDAVGNVTITGIEIWAPFETVVTALDRIFARDEHWQVDGEPGYWKDKRGRGKAVQIKCERVGVGNG